MSESKALEGMRVSVVSWNVLCNSYIGRNVPDVDAEARVGQIVSTLRDLAAGGTSATPVGVFCLQEVDMYAHLQEQLPGLGLDSVYLMCTGVWKVSLRCVCM
jgi:mRNA deadenylase 3'-5' endonuclease subunit Ccr4